MNRTSEPDRHAANAVADNVQSIAELEQAARRQVSLSERISTRITDFAGSMYFVGLHLGAFTIWAAWNLAAPAQLRFDPFPFGLLTMFVSLEGVFLATFVLITQNRLLAHSERRDHLALQVNMLAEQELTAALRMLRQLCEGAGVHPQTVDQRRVESLMEETNVYEVMKHIDRKLPQAPGSEPSDDD